MWARSEKIVYKEEMEIKIKLKWSLLLMERLVFGSGLQNLSRVQLFQALLPAWEF